MLLRELHFSIATNQTGQYCFLLMNGSLEPKILSSYWRLAALSRLELVRIGLMAIIMALIFVLFHCFGNMEQLERNRSVFTWMFRRWSDKASFGGVDYSHGFLIPLISLILVWMQRQTLMKAPKQMCHPGLALIVACLVLHWLGLKMQHPRLSLLALIGLSWSIPLYFYGRRIARSLVFPCSYLGFCIPLTFLDVLTFKMKMIATTMSTSLLYSLGIPAMHEGSRIFLLPRSLGIQLEVAAACSGLRSLLALSAITAVYAYLTRTSLIKRWLLFLSAVPLAVVGNIFRITTVGLVSKIISVDAGLDVYEKFSGFLVFSVAIVFMILLGECLQKEWRPSWQKLIQRFTPQD